MKAKNFWCIMWRSHEKTKRVLKMDFVNKDPKSDEEKEKGYTVRQKIGLFLGPLIFLVLLLMPTPVGMRIEAQRTLAITALMATWWICESIPIPATSLLPLILFPMLYVLPPVPAAYGYVNPNVLLFMGGFFIAEAMIKWNLHRRIALTIIHAIGRSPQLLVLGFMVASGFLSMWISNTATAMMMTAIGLGVIMYIEEMGKKVGVKGVSFEKGKFPFGIALMLGIAFSCSIGGIGTPIGTPPNVIFRGFIEEMGGPEVSFVQWMAFACPFVWPLIFIAWLWLTRVAQPIKLKEVPGGADVIGKQLKELGRMGRGEKIALSVFIGTAFLWVFRGIVIAFNWPPFPGLIHFMNYLHDCTIAILMAILLFLIPVNFKKGEFALDWKWAMKIPWGVLLLFGGGLALAEGWKESGLATWVGAQLSALQALNLVLIVFMIILLMVLMTEVTSNTATTAMMMPVLFSLAIVALNVHPFLLMIPAVMAVSCAFMLPVATPPNAIVFGSGYITVPQMVKAGVGLDLLAIPLNILISYVVVTAVFGIVWGVGGLPPWAI